MAISVENIFSQSINQHFRNILQNGAHAVLPMMKLTENIKRSNKIL